MRSGLWQRRIALTTLMMLPLLMGGAHAAKPNIVLIVADDLGYNDVGYHNDNIHTPNIDRIAKEGVKLERFYVQPVCTPTRAGLMTGRWPIRSGLMGAVIPPWRDAGLPVDEPTLPAILAEAGYDHRAAIGKWHLGHKRAKWLPRNRGFTHFYGHYNGAINYFTHERNGALDWHRNGELVREDGYSTTLLGKGAQRFIKGVPEDEPYLLYLSFNAVHRPLQVPEAAMERYPELEGRRKRYAAMTTVMDQAIGRVLETIDKRGQKDNTLVLFFSDNGGLAAFASNEPFRGEKSQVFEGGIRAAAAVRWPNGGLTGSRVVRQKMGYIDVLPTLRHIVGGTGEPAKPLDGINVLGAMRGEERLPARPWFAFMNQSEETRERIAVLYKGWKLRAVGPAATDPGFQDKAKFSLFNLNDDPRERNNLASERPGKVEALRKRLREFRALRPENHVPPYRDGLDNYDPPDTWQVSDSK